MLTYVCPTNPAAVEVLLVTVLLASADLAVSRCAWIACVQGAEEGLVRAQLRSRNVMNNSVSTQVIKFTQLLFFISPRRMRSKGHGTWFSLAFPDPTLKYREGVRGHAHQRLVQLEFSNCAM